MQRVAAERFRPVVRARLREGANRDFVRVIVAIGNELGIAVLAEGVETAAERDDLAALGCTRFQGYLFARPMPEPELLRWIAARPSDAAPFPPPLVVSSP